MDFSGLHNRTREGNVHSPAVSVIIPCYAAAGYIGTALDSVLNQTFTDYEVIVINDGSPDTEELESAIDVYRDRIMYVSQPNAGPGAARNTGVRLARGKYLAFLDADDYWLTNYLQQQIDFLSSHSSIDAVYADALIVGSSQLAGQTFMQATPSVGTVTCESLLAERCTIILSGTVVRRQSVVNAGSFDERFRYAEDFDLWVRMLKEGSRFEYQNEILLHRNEHADSLCSNTFRLFENALLVIEKIGLRNDLTAEERSALNERQAKLRAHLNLERAKQEFCARQFSSAVTQIREANKYYRSWKLYCAGLGIQIWPTMLLKAYSKRHSTAAQL